MYVSKSTGLIPQSTLSTKTPSHPSAWSISTHLIARISSLYVASSFSVTPTVRVAAASQLAVNEEDGAGQDTYWSVCRG